MVWNETTAIYVYVFACGALCGYMVLLWGLIANSRLNVRKRAIPSAFFGGVTAVCSVISYHWASKGVITADDLWIATLIACGMGSVGSNGPQILTRIARAALGLDKQQDDD